MKTGEACVRAKALPPASQVSATVGSQVTPFASLMTSGITWVLTVVDALATATLGFWPTIEYVNLDVPSVTVVE